MKFVKFMITKLLTLFVNQKTNVKMWLEWQAFIKFRAKLI